MSYDCRLFNSVNLPLQSCDNYFEFEPFKYIGGLSIALLYRTEVGRVYQQRRSQGAELADNTAT